jgi:hypothetical protein
MSTSVYMLYGGMTGGILDNPFNWGMAALRRRIEALPNILMHKYNWGSWQQAGLDVYADERGKIVICGYSGGGSRASWIANWLKHKRIDLLVTYDPSPAGQMRVIGENVLKAINYHNQKPGMWWPGVGALGGGVLLGPHVETVEVAQNHMWVQSNETLHVRTLREIAALR